MGKVGSLYPIPVYASSRGDGELWVCLPMFCHRGGLGELWVCLPQVKILVVAFLAFSVAQVCIVHGAFCDSFVEELLE